jgi:putative membrane-bound dehydrogenase-like protein
MIFPQSNSLVIALAACAWLAQIALASEPAAIEVESGPLPVPQALESFRLPDGLTIEVVASEPQIVDPVSARFDELGRLWVVEMRDYPHGPEPGQKPRSRIKVLTDRNRDGRFETVQVFADELLFVTGLQPWRAGVIVTMAGEIAYLRDTTGDGRADRRVSWYRGFAEENSQLRANHPRLGLDNQIYVANGLRGGKVVNPRAPNSPVISLNGKDFRFDPRDSSYEAVTGAGQFGTTFDDYGNRFTCTNRNPLIQIVLEERYARGNPHYAPRAVVHDVAAAGSASRIYPVSRAWTTSSLHANQFTAACGVGIYGGDALPSAYYGNAFTCDPTANLVHREVLRASGVTFESRPARDGVEFLTSPDEWFRPVNLSHGPDGALYVVDMYRAVIEHPQFMPEELKRRPDLMLGSDRGRIYRVTSDGTRSHRQQLDRSSSDRLIGYLAHPNVWHRETASRLLLERADPSANPSLRRLARSAASGSTRLRALWALDGQRALGEPDLLEALRDADPRVREQALVLAEHQAGESPRLREQMVSLARDSDPRVRFQLALSLGPAADAISVTALATIARTSTLDSWLRIAVAVAAADQPVELLDALLSDSKNHRRIEELQELIADLSAIAVRHGTPEASRALEVVMESANTETGSVRQATLLALSRALARKRSSLEQLPSLKLPTVGVAVRAATARAARTAGNPDEPPLLRAEAVELLSYDSAFEELLSELALAEPVQRVRIAAIAAISRRPDLATWRQLMRSYSGESPAVRRSIASVSVSRDRLTRVLLEAIEDRKINVSELDRSVVNRLLKHRDPSLRARVETLVADVVSEDRETALEKYRQILAWQADPWRGKQLFATHCASCHRVGGIGVNVAPDISDSRTKRPEQLLTDIVQPNRAVDGNYVSYSVLTADGLSYTGVIVSQSANSIKLRQPEGKEMMLLRSEIEELRSLGVSLMPDGLERNIGLQEMADLIAFVKNWRYLDGRTPLGSAGVRDGG